MKITKGEYMILPISPYSSNYNDRIIKKTQSFSAEEKNKEKINSNGQTLMQKLKENTKVFLGLISIVAFLAVFPMMGGTYDKSPTEGEKAYFSLLASLWRTIKRKFNKGST